MKRTPWKIAVACSIAFCFSSADLYARGFGGGGGIGGGGDGGHPAAGGGGGGGKHPAGGGGGGAPHAAAGPTSHAPAGGAAAATHVSGGGGGGHAPAIGRTPAFSHPNFTARPAGGGASRITAGPAAGTHPATGVHAGPATGGRPAGGATVGAHHPGAVAHAGAAAGAGGRLNGGAAVGRDSAGGNRAGITSRSYSGNALNYGNHNFNLAAGGYRPAYYGHGLYHGYWNGNYGFGGGWGYGGYGLGMGLGLGLGYGLSPLGWGYGGWGLGGLAYNSGYLGYSNPYYNNSYGGYNYAQPIPVDYSASPTAAVAEGNPADTTLNAAVAAFKQNDYDAALDIIDKGIAEYPTDSVMHEFRGLVLFAKGDYQQAAATIHSVLAIGPGWDWTTLASLYANIVTYTDQLRALESYIRVNPQDGAARFLAGYHYLSEGHTEAAASQFQKAVALVPGDRVANDIFKMISSPKTAQVAEGGEQPTPQPPVETHAAATTEATPVDPAMLVGSWKAAREDGANFELTLTPNDTFTWKFSQKQQPPQELTGKYTVDVNVLALEKKEGGSLIAEVTPGGPKAFNFKLLGGPPEDKGLDFTR